jgi:integrative and conjugative element protein (TIGR02256 family)
MLAYPIGTSKQLVVFSKPVIEYFLRNRQQRWWHRESGGQLFAEFNDNEIVVREATGPRRTDRRTRTSYIPDRKAEQREILEYHARGLHYVGDWHTHPEQHPTPSVPDDHSVAECVRKSRHNLNGFILVVVGQLEPPDGLSVCVHDGTHCYVLSPLAWTSQ